MKKKNTVSEPSCFFDDPFRRIVISTQKSGYLRPVIPPRRTPLLSCRSQRMPAHATLSRQAEPFKRLSSVQSDPAFKFPRADLLACLFRTPGDYSVQKPTQRLRQRRQASQSNYNFENNDMPKRVPSTFELSFGYQGVV